jgi:hypothetical protein
MVGYDFDHLMALPEHSFAAQQLLTKGAAEQLVFIIASAFKDAALAFRVLIAFSALPHTRPPAGAPEQSAALMSSITIYFLSGTTPSFNTSILSKLAAWSGVSFGAPVTQPVRTTNKKLIMINFISTPKT